MNLERVSPEKITQEDLVSIVMPVYNQEKYIKQAIDSVKNQTYKNWELLIIDDKSNDNTMKIVEENTIGINSRIIKLEKNSGVANARNLGMQEAKGKYVAYLDSDDMWKENKLEKQIKFMQDNNYDFTFTSFEYLKENKIKKVKNIPRKLEYKEALKNTAILTSTVIINVENVPKKLLKMPTIGSEDTATWWNILKNGFVANGLNEHLTTYRVIKKSLSHNKLKSIKRTWNLYRKHEKITFVKSIYYFLCYILNAIKKRIM